MIRLIEGDYLDVRLRESERPDLIVTSPPYNLGKPYSTSDRLDYARYLDWSMKWLARAFAQGRESCRLAINLPLDISLGGYQPVYADLVEVAKRIGWNYRFTIIWNEGNVSRRTAWGSWRQATAPHVIAPVETILVMHKDQWKRPKGISTTTAEQFKTWTNGLWPINGESAKRVGHPSPFPVELPFRLIQLLTFKGDNVLDPFVGAGTSLLAAQQSERNGVGVDIDPKALETARRRLKL